MTYIYVAFVGEHADEEAIGAFSDLEKAWDFAFDRSASSAAVCRFELDSTDPPVVMRWREWDWKTKTSITRDRRP